MISIPPVPHLHSTGQRSATLAGRNNKHNQKIKTGVANTSDSNNTVRFDGMTRWCNLQRERETDIELYYASCEGLRRGIYRGIDNDL